MMQDNKEVSALLKLIDDPDDEVYDTVVSKLLNYGREIIPNLEQLWETSIDEALQERIRALHPYELPEVVAVPITGGLPGYLAWITSCTEPVPD